MHKKDVIFDVNFLRKVATSHILINRWVTPNQRLQPNGGVAFYVIQRGLHLLFALGRSFVDQSTHDTHFIDPYFCDSSVLYFFVGRKVCNAMQSVNYPK
jgi:hypothetical protein